MRHLGFGATWPLSTLALFVISGYHLSEAGCPEPVFDNSTFVSKPTTFVRVGNSKFLYPREVFTAGAKYAMRICRDLGLQVAQVSNMEEYWQVIKEVVDGKKLRKSDGVMSVLVAGHLRRKGTPPPVATWVHPKSKEIIPFQMFKLKDGKYFEKGWECLVMECDKNDCYYVPKHYKKFNDAGGDPGVMPLCQFPKGSECYKSSTPNPEPAEDTEYWDIGDTKERIYYGSKVQKTRSQALEACKKGGMKLLSLFKNSVEETDKIMWFIANHASNRKSPIWDQATWTSGIFEREFSEKEFFDFESTGEQWSYADNKGHFEWSDKVKNPDEEKCLAVVKVEGKHMIRPLVCDLPNYFVCMKAKEGGSQAGRSFHGMAPEMGDSGEGDGDGKKHGHGHKHGDDGGDGGHGHGHKHDGDGDGHGHHHDGDGDGHGHKHDGDGHGHHDGDGHGHHDGDGDGHGHHGGDDDGDGHGHHHDGDGDGHGHHGGDDDGDGHGHHGGDGDGHGHHGGDGDGDGHGHHGGDGDGDGHGHHHDGDGDGHGHHDGDGDGHGHGHHHDGDGDDGDGGHGHGHKHDGDGHGHHHGRGVGPDGAAGDGAGGPNAGDGGANAGGDGANAGAGGPNAGAGGANAGGDGANAGAGGPNAGGDGANAGAGGPNAGNGGANAGGDGANAAGGGPNAGDGSGNAGDGSGSGSDDDDKICRDCGRDACACRQHPNCRFDNTGGGCDSEKNICKKLTFSNEECARVNGFYAMGGAVCKNTLASAPCTPVKTILAVNNGGEEHTDNAGTTYQAHSSVPVEDPFKLAKTGPCEEKPKITGVPAKDVPLYETHVWGEGREMASPHGGMCITYQIPAAQDGEYELALKTFEGLHDVQRSFNVKLNGMKVLREVNISQFAGGVDRPVDFLVNYRIAGDKLSLKGYPDTEILCDLIPLRFCLGDCKDKPESNANFRMSAFSVLQMKASGEPKAKGGIVQTGRIG